MYTMPFTSTGIFMLISQSGGGGGGGDWPTGSTDFPFLSFLLSLSIVNRNRRTNLFHGGGKRKEKRNEEDPSLGCTRGLSWWT